MATIKTFQDLKAVGENESDRMEFVLSAIKEHKASDLYRLAVDADLYYKHQNPTIMRYQKYLYNQHGQAVPDIWKPNNKIASNWYFYFTTQAVQYLLGNGVTFKDSKTKEKLGKDFDKKIQDVATYAKNGSVGFGFWNLDHIDIFKITEFVPLWDEENGSLMAGIRFWQIDDDKPLRATLYELDGYTEYKKSKDKDIEKVKEKSKYKQVVASSVADGETIVDGENYPSFPIVPLWNINRQSDLVGNQGTIDAYDLITSGLINNVDEGEFIYWIIKNCGGMSLEDDAKFVEQLKLTHVAHAEEDGAEVDAHKVEVPFEANTTAIERLKEQLYKDFMALKVEDISAGAVTATQIEAAYEPLNQKTDQFEYCVTDFIQKILELAGIEDEPTYTRSQMSNQTETIEKVLSAAEYLDDEYITRKILTLLGDADKADEVLKRKDAEDMERTPITPQIEQVEE